MRYAVVVPWYDPQQLRRFLDAWRVSLDHVPEWLFLTRDAAALGCAATKNRGLDDAVSKGAEVVVYLDDDCYPTEEAPTLEALAEGHLRCLEPQKVPLYLQVSEPASRGTPYLSGSATLPVAASMGFWMGVPDYCAVRQLAHAGLPMTFQRSAVYGRYFSLCGMNLAFRPADWLPWCRLIDVPRFDDIWMGWLWQREAYRRGFCFNLAGPMVHHARQSDPFRNLEVEARHLRASETLWQRIALHPEGDYVSLRALLPLDRGGSDR